MTQKHAKIEPNRVTVVILIGKNNSFPHTELSIKAQKYAKTKRKASSSPHLVNRQNSDKPMGCLLMDRCVWQEDILENGQKLNTMN